MAALCRTALRVRDAVKEQAPSSSEMLVSPNSHGHNYCNKQQGQNTIKDPSAGIYCHGE